MNFRKVLAMVLTVAMVVGLVIVPTSAAVGDTATLAELIPEADFESTFSVDTTDELSTGTATTAAEAKEHATYGGIVAFGSSTATAEDSSMYWQDTLPEGGVAHIKMVNVNCYSNAGFDIATSEGKRIRVIFNRTGNVMTAYAGGSSTTLTSSVNLASPFELIIKDTGSGFDYYVCQTGDANFTKAGENLAYPAAAATGTGVWALAGTGRGNLDAIMLYGPVETEEEPELPIDPETDEGFQAVLPIAGEAGSTVFASTATQEALTLTSTEGATSVLGGATIPSGGAVYYNFAAIEGTTMASPNFASVDTQVADGGSIRMQIGVETGNAIRFKNRSGSWTATGVTYDQVNLEDGFEIIVKDIGSAFEIWVRPDGAESFTLITSYNQTTEVKTTAITAGGTSVVKLTDAMILEPTTVEEPEEPVEEPIDPDSDAGFQAVLPTKGEAGAAIFASTATQEALTLTSTEGATSVLGGATIPSGGAVYYNFASFEGIAQANTGYVSVDTKAATGSIRMQIGVEATNAIRFKNRSSSWTATGVTYDQVNLEDGFEIIVKDIGSAFEIWVRPDGAENFTLMTSYNQCNDNNATSITATGTGVANLTDAMILEPTTAEGTGGGDEPDVPDEPTYTGTHTFAQVLNTTAPAAGETAYVFTEDETVASYTANTTNDTSATGFTSIPVGGAAHYKFSGITNSMLSGGNGYIQIHGAWAGGTQGYALYLGHSSAPIRFNCTLNGNTNNWAVETPEYLDITKPFDVIIKDNSSENSTTPVQLWVSIDNGETFTLVGEYARAAKKASLYVSSTDAVASTTISATVYTGKSMRGKLYVDESTILPTTASVGGTYYTEYATQGALTVTDTNTSDSATTSVNIFGGNTFIPAGGAIRYKFTSITGTTNNNVNFVQVTQDIEGGAPASSDLQIGGGSTDAEIHSYPGANWNDASGIIAAKGEIDLTKGFELIIKHDGSTLTYYIKADGDTGFWLAAENVIVGNNASRKAQIGVKGAAVANLESATIYYGMKASNGAVVAEIYESGAVHVLSKAGVTGTFIAAGYTGEDAYEMKCIETVSGTEKFMTFEFSDSDVEYVKLFLWDGINTMTPVAGYDVQTLTKVTAE